MRLVIPSALLCLALMMSPAYAGDYEKQYISEKLASGFDLMEHLIYTNYSTSGVSTTYYYRASYIFIGDEALEFCTLGQNNNSLRRNKKPYKEFFECFSANRKSPIGSALTSNYKSMDWDPIGERFSILYEDKYLICEFGAEIDGTQRRENTCEEL